MTGDEELDAILAKLWGDLDDAELDRRAAGFGGALRRLRDDPAEASRIDALVADAGDDPTVVALVAHATGGDRDAWAEIVERYAPLVWSICSRFNLSSADTQDVAQTVWLRLVEQLGELREPAALPGWLATTTHRECLRVMTAARKTGQRRTWPDEALQFVDDRAIDEQILLAERNAALPEALAELPPRCQQLLSMLLADPPCSYAEISRTLHIPIGSIGPQRARCLERLRRSNALIAWRQEQPSPPTWGRGQVHDSPDGRSLGPPCRRSRPPPRSLCASSTAACCTTHRVSGLSVALIYSNGSAVSRPSVGWLTSCMRGWRTTSSCAPCSRAISLAVG